MILFHNSTIFYYLIEFPQFGQNFGGFDGSILHPQLSHAVICKGFGLPQFGQNLPVLTLPHEQVHSSETGFGLPHSEQNLPILPFFPHEQFQLSAIGFDGLFCSAG